MYVFINNAQYETDSEVIKFQIQMQISLESPDYKRNSSFTLLSSGQKRDRPSNGLTLVRLKLLHALCTLLTLCTNLL